MAFLTEDRRAEGLMMGAAIADNIGLARCRASRLAGDACSSAPAWAMRSTGPAATCR